MTVPSVPTADGMLPLLGRKLDDPQVQAALEQFAHGMQPELDPDDEDSLFDWVTVNELGVEYGFMDEAYLRALDPDERKRGPLILFQIFFYAETETMRAFPFSLPFGLALGDDRGAVRKKLAQWEPLRRTYERDFWALPQFNLAIKYKQSGTIEIVYCYLPYTPWPDAPGAAQLAARFPPKKFQTLFGARWSSELLRTELAPLGYDAELPMVRSEHMAHFEVDHGLSLTFVPAEKVPAADQSAPMTLVLGGVSFYAARDEADARQWQGELPAGLKFDDTPRELQAKLGKKPAESLEDEFSGIAVWHLPEYTLHVEYSTLENRLVIVTIYAPGFWDATK